MTLRGGGASANMRVEVGVAPRVQIDRMRLLQVQAQLGVVPPAAPQLEEPSLCVASIHTRKQHVATACMYCGRRVPNGCPEVK